MSAFLVSDKHIDALLSAAMRFAYCGDSSYYFDCRRHNFMLSTVKRIGQTLVNQNYRSLTERYGDPYRPHEYVPHTDGHNHSPVEILKLCNCYDYQACETDDYPTTEAHEIVDAIRHTAIRELDGYEEAKWSI